MAATLNSPLLQLLEYFIFDQKQDYEIGLGGRYTIML